MTFEFDFIIIGGGTSGLVVASRLSEDPSVHVLVLEAGTNHAEDPRVKIPALFDALKGTEADWGFESEAQAELKGRKVNYSQGRALGGSSAINAQVFVPPSKTTIDSWELLGNAGWNWETLKPYYAKAFSNPALQPELKKHIGIEWEVNKSPGPIQTSYASGIQDPISKAWVETFSNIGLNMERDPFAGSDMGAFAALASIDPATKERSYAATAYYIPIAHRQNLHVSLNSEVQRVVLERNTSGYFASGVQYKLNDQILTVTARHEIILAAGTIQSPKLLELSGIGDSTLLHSHGIDIKIDNKFVGENLQDHFFCAIGFEAQDLVPTLDSLVRQEPQAIEAAMGQYMVSKDGPFASVGVDACAYLPFADINGNGKTKLEKLIDGNESKEDLSPLTKLYHDAMRQQLMSKDGPPGTYLTLAAQYMIPVDPDFEGSPKGPLPGKFVAIGSLLSQPLSRGSVHSSSRNPAAKPLIDPKFISHPFDLELLAHQMSYIPQIAGMEPLKPTIFKEGGRRWDPKSIFKNLDDAKDFVRTSGASMWHPTSTCSMLPKDLGGVVNDRLLVYGTTNLRIVDASIMPVIPVANIQSSVYAVAERASDIIKIDNGLKNVE